MAKPRVKAPDVRELISKEVLGKQYGKVLPIIPMIYDRYPARFDFSTYEKAMENIRWWGLANISVITLAGIMGLTLKDLSELFRERPELEAAYTNGRQIGTATLMRTIYEKAIQGEMRAIELYFKIHPMYSEEKNVLDTMYGEKSLREEVFVGFEVNAK